MKNKRKDSTRAMHLSVNINQGIVLFKGFYSYWVSSIMANVPICRVGYPSSIPGSSTATYKYHG